MSYRVPMIIASVYLALCVALAVGALHFITPTLAYSWPAA